MSLHYSFELEVGLQGIAPILKRVLSDPAFVLVERVGYESLEELYDVQVEGAERGFEILNGLLRKFGNCFFQVIESASQRDIRIDVDEKSFGFLINARLGWTEEDCLRMIRSWAAESFDQSKLRLEYV